jgi:cystathionine beta-synthase
MTTASVCGLGVLLLIGRTPVIELRGFDTGMCRLFVKLETQNSGGSIKDRIALSMIEAAEEKGALSPRDTIVEAGLALVAAVKGDKLTLTIPDRMSKEKIEHLRACGADVRLTRSDVPTGHIPKITSNWQRESQAQQIPIISTSSRTKLKRLGMREGSRYRAATRREPAPLSN